MPNDFAREWIEKRLAGQVAEALSEVLGDTVDVRVVVDERAAELPQQTAAAEAAAEPAVPPAGGRQGQTPPAAARRAAPRPSPTSIRATSSTASSPARTTSTRRPWRAASPSRRRPRTTRCSCTPTPASARRTSSRPSPTRRSSSTRSCRSSTSPCEQFTDDFINGVTDKSRVDGFKTKYRANDILLIDDVQFLAEKQRTQVEFFHTFNALYEAGKQIVITSDRPPRELEALEERLRSRFGQGVVVDISRPDLETRIAILRKQVKWEGFQIAEPDVLEWIAARVTTQHPRAVRRAHARGQLSPPSAAARSRSTSPRKPSRTSSPRPTSTR